MNQREWKKSGKFHGKYEWYNKTRKIQLSLKYNQDENANRIHHLRDTEEQRRYNDEHYELWGHNLDGTFEYGKYVIFVTEEWHNNYHKDSEETKQKKSDASKKRWEDSEYRESQTAAIIKAWSEDDRRQRRSDAYTCEGNPFYGKHHSQETIEKLSGENNGMYGKHHTEEARKKMSDSKTGHIVTEETRAKISSSNIGHEVSAETKEKISIANTGRQHTEEFKHHFSEKYTGEGNPFYGKHHSKEVKEKYFIGENNPMYGKHHSEEAKRIISEANKGKIVSQETRDKLKNSRGTKLQKLASVAYKEYRSNGGTAEWQDFRREFFRLNR